MKTRIISLIILLVLSTSCKKEKSEVAPAPQQSISASKTTTTTSPCPEGIRLTGNSPSGNKLQAKFNPANVPYAIRVVQNGTATTDQGSTAGNSGVWNSQNKYTSPELGLQLLDANGNVICTCNYDANGKLKPAVVNASVISDYALNFDGTVTATISWKSVEESGVKAYVVERYDAFTLDKNLLIQGAGIVGPGNTYTLVDNEVYSIPSNYNYKLFAIFNDNTKLLLAEKQVAWNTCSITDFNPVFDGSSIGVTTWRSTEEVNVKSYVLERYNDATHIGDIVVDALGAGNSYRIEEDGTWGTTRGKYFLLYCIFSDNSKVLIAQKGMHAPPDAAVGYFEITVPSENVVTLRWNSTIESMVELYYFERQDPGSNQFVKIENPQYGQSGGAFYSTDDVVTGPGTYTYRLYAQFLNNSPLPKLVSTTTVVMPAFAQ